MTIKRPNHVYRAIEACAMMASNSREKTAEDFVVRSSAETEEPCTRLADAINVDSYGGRLAAAAFELVPSKLPWRERWAAAEQMLRWDLAYILRRAP